MVACAGPTRSVASWCNRRPDTPIVTDFVACIECNAMYWLPSRNSGVREPFDYDKAYAHMPKRKPGEKS